MTTQIAMFTQGEDTPLFSQTPIKAQPQIFRPAIKAPQPNLLKAKCGICLDTGKVGGMRTRCICGAR